jgi:hypothetical protein
MTIANGRKTREIMQAPWQLDGRTWPDFGGTASGRIGSVILIGFVAQANFRAAVDRICPTFGDFAGGENATYGSFATRMWPFGNNGRTSIASSVCAP